MSGQMLSFHATHFDYGADANEPRSQAADVVLSELPPGPAVVAGDLNAEPDEAAEHHDASSWKPRADVGNEIEAEPIWKQIVDES
jgi:endonuclease/exonuclease/phosphatase family metal-dependent hydrolase